MGTVLTDEESRLLTGKYFVFLSSTEAMDDDEAYLISNGLFCVVDYVYHTLAAKASGELCLKYIFSFGAFARKPLLQRFVHQF